MSDIIIFFLLAITAYLAGSIPFGLLLARSQGVDIRATGSGNIGATNVFRTLGKTLGVTTFALDALKGFLPVYLLPLLLSPESSPTRATAAVIFAFLSVAGHIWPITLRFKGGKGIATGGGALLGIAPPCVATAFIAWLIIVITTRYVSLASIAAALSLALSCWFFYGTCAAR